MTDYRDDLFDVLVTAPVNNQNAQFEASSSRATRNTLKLAWAKVPRAFPSSAVATFASHP